MLSEDRRFAVGAEDLPHDIDDLAQRAVAPGRCDQGGHHVLGAGTDPPDLLEGRRLSGEEQDLLDEFIRAHQGT